MSTATARPPPLPLWEPAHENINENVNGLNLCHPDNTMAITKEAERICTEQRERTSRAIDSALAAAICAEEEANIDIVREHLRLPIDGQDYDRSHVLRKPEGFRTWTSSTRRRSSLRKAKVGRENPAGPPWAREFRELMANQGWFNTLQTTESDKPTYTPLLGRSTASPPRALEPENPLAVQSTPHAGGIPKTSYNAPSVYHSRRVLEQPLLQEEQVEFGQSLVHAPGQRGGSRNVWGEDDVEDTNKVVIDDTWAVRKLAEIRRRSRTIESSSVTLAVKQVSTVSRGCTGLDGGDGDNSRQSAGCREVEKAANVDGVLKEQSIAERDHDAEINIDATEETVPPSSRAGRVRLAPLPDMRNGINQAELGSDTVTSFHPLGPANSQDKPDLVDAGTVSVELAKETSSGDKRNEEPYPVEEAKTSSEPAMQDASGALPYEDVRSLSNGVVAEDRSGQAKIYEKAPEEAPPISGGSGNGSGGDDIDAGTGNGAEVRHNRRRNDATMWSWRRRRRQEQKTSTREEEQRAKDNRAKRVLQVLMRSQLIFQRNAERRRRSLEDPCPSSLHKSNSPPATAIVSSVVVNMTNRRRHSTTSARSYDNTPSASSEAKTTTGGGPNSPQKDEGVSQLVQRDACGAAGGGNEGFSAAPAGLAADRSKDGVKAAARRVTERKREEKEHEEARRKEAADRRKAERAFHEGVRSIVAGTARGTAPKVVCTSGEGGVEGLPRRTHNADIPLPHAEMFTPWSSTSTAEELPTSAKTVVEVRPMTTMFAERDAQAAKKRLRERDRKRMLEASEEKATTDRLMVELHRRREASVKACAARLRHGAATRRRQSLQEEYERKRSLEELEVMTRIDSRLAASGRAMARRRLKAAALTSTAEKTVTTDAKRKSSGMIHNSTKRAGVVVTAKNNYKGEEARSSSPSRIWSRQRLRRERRRRRLSGKVGKEFDAEVPDGDGSTQVASQEVTAPSATVGSTTAVRSIAVAKARVLAKTENGAFEAKECRTQVNELSGKTRNKRNNRRRAAASPSSQQLDDCDWSSSPSVIAEVLEIGTIRREWNQTGAAPLSLPARKERKSVDHVGKGKRNGQSGARVQHVGRAPAMVVPMHDAGAVIHGVAALSREEHTRDIGGSFAFVATGGELGPECNPEQGRVDAGGGARGDSCRFGTHNDLNDRVTGGWLEEEPLGNEHEQREDVGMGVEAQAGVGGSTRKFRGVSRVERIREHQEHAAVPVVPEKEKEQREEQDEVQNKKGQRGRGEVFGYQIPADAGMEIGVMDGGARGTGTHCWLSEAQGEPAIADGGGGIVAHESTESGPKWAANETAIHDGIVPGKCSVVVDQGIVGQSIVDEYAEGDVDSTQIFYGLLDTHGNDGEDDLCNNSVFTPEGSEAVKTGGTKIMKEDDIPRRQIVDGGQLQLVEGQSGS